MKSDQFVGDARITQAAVWTVTVAVSFLISNMWADCRLMNRMGYDIYQYGWPLIVAEVILPVNDPAIWSIYPINCIVNGVTALCVLMALVWRALVAPSNVGRLVDLFVIFMLIGITMLFTAIVMSNPPSKNMLNWQDVLNRIDARRPPAAWPQIFIRHQALCVIIPLTFLEILRRTYQSTRRLLM